MAQPEVKVRKRKVIDAPEGAVKVRTRKRAPVYPRSDYSKGEPARWGAAGVEVAQWPNGSAAMRGPHTVGYQHTPHEPGQEDERNPNFCGRKMMDGSKHTVWKFDHNKGRYLDKRVFASSLDAWKHLLK